MSGAEAILGVVAGGAGLLSLAIQLCESARKLNSIRHSIRGAPESLRDLAFDLETMALSLEHIERFRQHDQDSAALIIRCADRCRRSTAKIQEVVDAMERYICRHSALGRAYVAIKERDTDKLLSELDQAKSSLQLALMMYNMEEQAGQSQAQRDLLASQHSQLSSLHALLRESPTISIARLEEAGDVVETECYISSLSDNKTLSTRRTRAVRRTQRSFRISLPNWATSLVWDLAMTQTQRGWDLSLRTYNARPRGSEIFMLCLKGDLAGMQRLIASGSASLFDVDLCHSKPSLLEKAADQGHLHVCEWLLSQSSWSCNDSILHWAFARYLYYNRMFGRRQKLAEAAYRLFVERHGLDVDLESPTTFRTWWNLCPDKGCMDVILRNQSLPMSCTSPEERLAFAEQPLINVGSLTGAELLVTLGISLTDPGTATLTVDNRSVLHLIARWLSEAPDTSTQRNLTDLGIQAIRNGADPVAVAPSYHNRFDDRHERRATPLLESLFPRDVQHDGCYPCLQRSLVRTWAAMIKHAGLDLLEYATDEQRAWQEVGVQSDMYWDEMHCEWAYPQQLIYGSSPCDWSLTFRRTVKIPVCKVIGMPGSFPRHHYMPELICWLPSWGSSEEDEGRWRTVNSLRVHSAPFSVCPDHEVSTTPRETAEDDAGPIMAKNEKLRRLITKTRRSRSLPPWIPRTRLGHRDWTDDWPDVHPWLSPADRAHICGTQPIGRYDAEKERICALGGCEGTGRTSVQEQFGWTLRSFSAVSFAVKEADFIISRNHGQAC